MGGWRSRTRGGGQRWCPQGTAAPVGPQTAPPSCPALGSRLHWRQLGVETFPGVWFQPHPRPPSPPWCHVGQVSRSACQVEAEDCHLKDSRLLQCKAGWFLGLVPSRFSLFLAPSRPLYFRLFTGCPTPPLPHFRPLHPFLLPHIPTSAPAHRRGASCCFGCPGDRQTGRWVLPWVRGGGGGAEDRRWCP